MSTFTYSAILIIVFFAAIFLFTYFETPRKTLKRGMKKLKVQVLNLNKNTGTLRFPLDPKTALKNKDSGDLKVFMHEY